MIHLAYINIGIMRNSFNFYVGICYSKVKSAWIILVMIAAMQFVQAQQLTYQGFNKVEFESRWYSLSALGNESSLEIPADLMSQFSRAKRSVVIHRVSTAVCIAGTATLSVVALTSPINYDGISWERLGYGVLSIFSAGVSITTIALTKRRSKKLTKAFVKCYNEKFSDALINRGSPDLAIDFGHTNHGIGVRLRF